MYPSPVIVARPFVEPSKLVSPRIELRVQRRESEPSVLELDQNLVFGLREGDSRREKLEGDKFVDVPHEHISMAYQTLELCPTRKLVIEDQGWIVCADASLDRAVRDGRVLNLPVYVVAEGRCQRIDH